MNRAIAAAALVLALGAFALALALALALSRPAGAQTLCAPAPDLLAGLRQKHGEEPVWTGRAGEARLVLTQSPGGKWSLIRIAPGGDVACLIGAGDRAANPRGREI